LTGNGVKSQILSQKGQPPSKGSTENESSNCVSKAVLGGFAGALETELFRREEIEDPTSKVGIHLQSPLSPSNYSSPSLQQKKEREMVCFYIIYFRLRISAAATATIMMATAAMAM
jgi:hypothetical protein